MGEIYRYTDTQVLGFVLVLMRIGAFLVSWPVLSGTLVPRPIQVLMAFAITMMVFPIISWQQVSGNLESGDLIWLVVREVFIGLSLGLISRFFLLAVSICGEIVGITMGLTGAQIFNPTMNTRSGVVEQFQIILASMYFLAMQGHHLFLAALFKTYEILPISNAGINYKGFPGLAEVAQDFTIAGIKMSAPVMAAVFLVNITMGIIGRAVPQINVLVTSMPVNILVSIGVMIVSLPLFVTGLEEHIFEAMNKSIELIKSY